MSYVRPKYGLRGYTCPHCGFLAQMTHQARSLNLGAHFADDAQNVIRTSICHHCQKGQLWYVDQLVYPVRGFSPPPNPDMPAEVQTLYQEAAGVSGQSPRAAAALLRLAVQHLCVHLGASGKDINQDIGALVAAGMPQLLQQSLDALRVIGNHAVHPGTIDVDSPETAGKLFEMLNVVVEYTIGLPKRVGTIYNGLPEDALRAIEKRDGE